MNVIVQKFGGTSVATKEAREQVIKHITKAQENGFSPVIVLSAMGRKGDPYATDTLLGFIAEAGPDIPKREQDLIMSCGEIISCTLVSSLLSALGHKSRSFTGAQAGIVTDTKFGDARIVEILPEPLSKALQEGIIPVVAGFQGRTTSGDITTLGRGGSDTTAAALGAALGAQFVEIFTDVEGIMTADPRLVGKARMLDIITYEEVGQLAIQGAKIVHPRALDLLMQHGIPLKVRSTFSETNGTLVSRDNCFRGESSFGSSNVITGIAHKPNIAQIKVKFPDKQINQDTFLFKSLAAEKISIDIINVFPELKVFTVAEADLPTATEILKQSGFESEIYPGLAKVSLVGTGMRGVPGVMAKVVEILNSHDIQILQTSDSHSTISCVIQAEDTVEAVQALHDGFALDNKEL